MFYRRSASDPQFYWERQFSVFSGFWGLSNQTVGITGGPRPILATCRASRLVFRSACRVVARLPSEDAGWLFENGLPIAQADGGRMPASGPSADLRAGNQSAQGNSQAGL